MTRLGFKKCCIIEGVQKHKQYELKNIYNKFKQYILYKIITYNSKQTQILSITFEIGVQRSIMLPTQVSNSHLI